MFKTTVIDILFLNLTEFHLCLNPIWPKIRIVIVPSKPSLPGWQRLWQPFFERWLSEWFYHFRSVAAATTEDRTEQVGHHSRTWNGFWIHGHCWMRSGWFRTGHGGRRMLTTIFVVCRWWGLSESGATFAGRKHDAAEPLSFQLCKSSFRSTESVCHWLQLGQ